LGSVAIIDERNARDDTVNGEQITQLFFGHIGSDITHKNIDHALIFNRCDSARHREAGTCSRDAVSHLMKVEFALKEKRRLLFKIASFRFWNLCRSNVFRLPALRSLGDVKLNGLTFLQAAETACLNG